MFGLVLQSSQSFMSVFLHVSLSKSFQALCHVSSSPLALRYTGLSTQMSQCVSVHLYLNMQSLHRSADITRTVSWCLEGLRFEYSPTSSAKTYPFLPRGYTKTGHSSITITLIKRETKAQHSHKQQTTLEIVSRGLNQNFSCMPKLVVHDSISKTKLVNKTLT